MTSRSVAVTRLRRISWLFDELVRIPGTNIRLGLDAVMGLIPGGGDVVGGAVSVYALFVARRLGAPTSVILRMALNILIDAVLGAVPFIGDLFDVSWKANRKNVQVLEQFMAAPQRAERSSLIVVAVTALAVVGSLVGIAAATVWLISRIF
jgi:hypothetical protein